MTGLYIPQLVTHLPWRGGRRGPSPWILRLGRRLSVTDSRKELVRQPTHLHGVVQRRERALREVVGEALFHMARLVDQTLAAFVVDRVVTVRPRLLVDLGLHVGVHGVARV